MAEFDLDSESRFRKTEIIPINGEFSFGLFKPPSFLDPVNLRDSDIIQFKVRPPFARSPWRIANNVYGNPLLDWVVIHFKPNQPLNVLNWPENGTIILLPSPNVVLGAGF